MLIAFPLAPGTTRSPRPAQRASADAEWGEGAPRAAAGGSGRSPELMKPLDITWKR